MWEESQKLSPNVFFAIIGCTFIIPQASAAENRPINPALGTIALEKPEPAQLLKNAVNQACVWVVSTE